MEEFYRDIDLTEEIDDLEKKFKKDKSVAMIGLGDSIGFSPSDYNYLDRLIRSIEFDCKLNVFNGHFLTTGTERQLEDVILSNITLEDVKNINQLELDMLIAEKLKEKRLPNDKKVIKLLKAILGYKDRTFISGYEKLSLEDALRISHSANVFYFANNNIFYRNVADSFLNSEQEQRRRNYDHILNMNPDTTIYAFGLVAPNNFNNTLENVRRHNDFYQELSTEFGMVYVDPKGLNKYLKKEEDKLILVPEGVGLLTLKCIKAMHENLKREKETSTKANPREYKEVTGIDLLIKKAKDRIDYYDEQLDDKTYYQFDKMFTASRMREEKERVKILKKLKKEEPYFE